MSNLYEDNPDVISAAEPITAGLPEEPVLVFEASSNEELEIVRATLEAAGIPAMLQNATANPYAGAIDGSVDSLWVHGVYVAPSNLEAARSIINAPAPTEEDLAAEEEADPMTLEEAEARVKDL